MDTDLYEKLATMAGKLRNPEAERFKWVKEEIERAERKEKEEKEREERKEKEEQVFSACDPDFVTYAKDRHPKSSEELKKIAISYSLSRPDKTFANVKTDLVAFSANSADHTLSGRGGHQSRSASRHFQQRQDRSISPSLRVTCFNCGKQGHVQKECRAPKSNTVGHRAQNTMDGQREGVTCYNCGGRGHVRSQCPTQRRNRSNTRKGNTANVAIVTDQGFVPITDQPTCSTGIIDRNGSIVLHNAFLNGKKCTLLRDSGCTCVGVRKSLVPYDSHTGKTVKVRTFLGQLESVSTAIIHLDSNFFTGNVEACVLPDPVSDVILGKHNWSG
ncbi:Gag-Pol polyprotein [Plakobranchus ocellatus]|uniref:Gag-Pol polyprotein n=1 Tax=Plakobranchus ocellatus TaxID=259542 RepID=A0AAV3ZA03_9GAST|nr:Gag-Pol polyprotein [Plakobranchus ocellatus]